MNSWNMLLGEGMFRVLEFLCLSVVLVIKKKKKHLCVYKSLEIYVCIKARRTAHQKKIFFTVPEFF